MTYLNYDARKDGLSIRDSDELLEIWRDADILVGQYTGSFKVNFFSNFLTIDKRRTRFAAGICGGPSEIPSFTGGEHQKQLL